MSVKSGTETPLGANALAGLLQNKGFAINTSAAANMGSSTAIGNYTQGSVCTSTVLGTLTTAIRNAWGLLSGLSISSSTYDAIITIGSTTIPALGNTPPSSYTYTGSPGWGGASYNNEIASYGFIRLFAWQAYNEFNYNNTFALTGSYKDFLGSLQDAGGFIGQSNAAILTLSNATNFLDGTYSNMNDLISANITGVSLSTIMFGQDLISSGKAINLSTIDTFGLPSNLLQTLSQYNAVTQSLGLALLASGLTTNEISLAIENNNVPNEIQQKIYAAFLIINGVDLADIRVALNCNTKGLSTLADLLNVQKLFPNSYSTLTVPVYNIAPGPTNSKTYYFLYSGTGVNTSLYTKFGEDLVDILPKDIATTANAFSVSLRQINNIQNLEIEKFAQVVQSIETTNGLTVNGTSVPADVAEVNAAKALIAFGSGPNSTYTYSDFFGCMSALPYPWALIKTLILSVQTTALQTAYNDLSTAIAAVDEPAMLLAIAAANTEIARIYATNTANVQNLNTIWKNIGKQLGNEQRARNIGLSAPPSPRTDMYSYPSVVYSTASSLPSLALDTAPHMSAQTIEAICDYATPAGQSITARMREARNTSRLSEAGISQDNLIDDALTPQEQTVLIANGVLPDTLPATLVQEIPPIVAGPATIVQPTPMGFYDADTEDYNLTVLTSPEVPIGIIPETGQEYFPASSGTPLGTLVTGSAIEPGSLAGSPYTNLIDPSLNSVYTSNTLTPATYSISDAINEVVHCNCDCWIV